MCIFCRLQKLLRMSKNRDFIKACDDKSVHAKNLKITFQKKKLNFDIPYQLKIIKQIEGGV